MSGKPSERPSCVVSEPGAAVKVTKFYLTPEEQEALSTGGARIPPSGDALPAWVDKLITHWETPGGRSPLRKRIVARRKALQAQGCTYDAQLEATLMECADQLRRCAQEARE